MSDLLVLIIVTAAMFITVVGIIATGQRKARRAADTKADRAAREMVQSPRA